MVLIIIHDIQENVQLSALRNCHIDVESFDRTARESEEIR